VLSLKSFAWTFGLSLVALFSQGAWGEDPSVHFRRRVEPLLRERCFSCHSHSAGQMENGLALDWKSGWVTGGQRGPAVVPGNPDESLLIRAVQHLDPQLKMPEEKLADADIQVLIEWVRQGAFDDRVSAPAATQTTDWWSLKPLVIPPVPQSAASNGVTHPIDAFIGDRLTAAGLSFSAEASPRDLIRRLHFDLVGLPPSPEEVARFEADPSPAAYEQLVDALLASPRYGERWARHWFDTIHFADSHGYEHDVGRDHAWPYRDYVISALNDDLPWATFIRQQLAVDHFEPESSHVVPALGFLGAGVFDYSTYATGPVTFDYLDRDDLLTQTMAAFVSTTANCARCHAHKFDPIAQEDYYALQAVFAGIVKGDVRYDRDTNIAAQRRQLTSLIDAAKRGDEAVLNSELSRGLVARWVSQRPPAADWKPVELQSFVSINGTVLTRDTDGLIVAGGPVPDQDQYVVTFKSPVSRLTAVRLQLQPHDSLPQKGPGRCHNGNLHLSDVLLTAFLPGETTGRAVRWGRASADFNQEGFTIEQALDGNPKTSWGIYPAIGQPHSAVFELAEPLDLPAGSLMTFTIKQVHGGSHLIGAFRLAVTASPAEQTTAIPHDVEQALQSDPSQQSPAQWLSLARYAVQQTAEAELKRLPAQSVVYAAASSVDIPMGDGKTLPASRPMPKVVHLLQRGDLNKPQQEVPPGALSALTHLPARFTETIDQKEAARRGALADWIAHRDNVLTWRSAVNRVWHFHFGRGLCDTPSDFGRMGGTPSHPELIDWLAIWFRDEAGGSLKALHRLMVTSRTYRQSTHIHSDSLAVDAENRLLWRQNRLRLDADAYRDFVLSVSGRIDFTMGGPAVEHFLRLPGIQLTPKLDYIAYDWASPGSNRRSIYRYVWRGIPDPLMASLDFPDLGLLSPTRSLSISPLQALALYNNSFVLFHSEAMAQHITAQASDVDQQVRMAIQRSYQRAPTAAEQERFRDFVQRHGLAGLCRLLLNSSEFLFIP
jgi:hypothetical protein